MKSKVYSLHIGVSLADSQHYGNLLVPLPCCSTDASFMYRIGKVFKYDESKLLIDEQATTKNVKDQITIYSSKAKSGDLVVVTYSGHGSKLPDLNGDEVDGEDQTWCLFDRQLIDDEMRYLWKSFKPGVNVFLVIDSCHSGTAFKNISIDIDDSKSLNIPIDYSDKVKSVSSKNYLKILRNNKELYEPIMQQRLVGEEEIRCYVLAITACQDHEEALAGSYLSYFTSLLIKTLSGEYNKIENYEDLKVQLSKVSEKEKGISPNLSGFGNPTDFFKNNKPFIRLHEDYPEGTRNLFADLLFERGSTIEKHLIDQGLIVDLLKGDSKDLNFLSGSKEINRISKQLNDYYIPNTIAHKSIAHPWDRAYQLYDELKNAKCSSYIEPAIIPNIEHEPSPKSPDRNEYLANWPDPGNSTNEFTWHLDLSHSQLAAARDQVIEEISKQDQNIKIAHIDTGYTRTHEGLPSKLSNGISFVDGEEGDPAFDYEKNKLIEQQDHGTATLCLLAGKEVRENIAYGEGNRKLGAIPFATIYPIRISDSVALTSLIGNAVPFVKAIRRAIEMDCEVITISMGGLPIRAWAKAINEAYEAGITIVAAAGNSWVKGIAKIAPRKILYPARFERVIAATGACFNNYPYVASANPDFRKSKTAGGNFMQGNYLPRNAMSTSLAAYTPNVPWATFADKNKSKSRFLKSGGGTSSATPQVAAAAALWIVKNKNELIGKGYHKTWRQVEAVKQALFQGADKTYPLYKVYYGNGMLKATNSLEIKVPSKNSLKKAKKATVSPLALIEYIKVLITRKSFSLQSEKFDKIKSEMILQEIVQIIEQDPQLVEMYAELDLMDEQDPIDNEQFASICEQVRTSPFTSEYLKSIL